MSYDEVEVLRRKKICHKCVAERYLSEEIERRGRRLKCSYCGTTAKCYRLEELSERIAGAFAEHFTRTPDQPNAFESSMQADRESTYEWDRRGEPVVDAIREAAEIPDAAASDVQAILEDDHSDFDADAFGDETEFAAGSCYEERDVSDDTWLDEWRAFEHTLKTRARYFGGGAAGLLESVFGGVDAMVSAAGRPLIVDAGPGTAITRLYRARVFQSDEKLEVALGRPDRDLGSTPAALAAAGRMNARGISVFYGANHPLVALAEVRTPVGSQVAVARFDIVRPLRLLDLTAFASVRVRGSIFDPAFKGQLERAAFLKSLAMRISRPVMPDDEEFEYLATQAVADFLATRPDVVIDGIIYASAQTRLPRKGGKRRVARNVALFHKAARVEELSLPEGTKLEASTSQMYEGGPEREYTVVEVVPTIEPIREEEPTPGISTPPLRLDGAELAALARELALPDSDDRMATPCASTWNQCACTSSWRYGSRPRVTGCTGIVQIPGIPHSSGSRQRCIELRRAECERGEELAPRVRGHPSRRRKRGGHNGDHERGIVSAHRTSPPVRKKARLVRRTRCSRWTPSAR